MDEEKLQKLLDDSEKALQQVERSLGAEHEVVAKMLDTYAQLLRQNNIRYLDAINMEARAKAIRAKLNKTAAVQQASKLGEEFDRKRKESRQQAKRNEAILGILVVCLLLGGGIVLYKSMQPKPDMDPLAEAKLAQELLTEYRDNKAAELAKAKQAEESKEAMEEAALEGGVNVQAMNAVADVKRQVKKLTLVEYAQRAMRLKKEVKALVHRGQELFKLNQIQDAEDCFSAAIEKRDQAIQEVGKPISFEESAVAYEMKSDICRRKGDSAAAYDNLKEAENIRKQMRTQLQ